MQRQYMKKNNENNEFQKGDFVWLNYPTKIVFPGRILSVKDDIYRVEICTDKLKKSKNETEIVECTKDRLIRRDFGI